MVNPFWPSDANKSDSTLARTIAWCLTAPSNYLNQCWLIISEVLWHSHEENFIENAWDIYPWYVFENYWFKITAASPRGEWIHHDLLTLWPLCFVAHGLLAGHQSSSSRTDQNRRRTNSAKRTSTWAWVYCWSSINLSFWSVSIRDTVQPV